MFADRKKIIEALNSADDYRKIFDGSDYERGQLEALEATVDNLQRFCLKLAATLVAKNIVTKAEAVDLIYECTDKWSVQELKALDDIH